MRCRTCDEEPCMCVSIPAVKIRSTYQEIPKGITKEEFGSALYDTIKTIGGILAQQEYHQRAVWIEDQVGIQTALRARADLLRRLRDQMPRLTNDEAGQIVRRYPWVAHV